jgi:small subunit ribosomal protein S18
MSKEQVIRTRKRRRRVCGFCVDKAEVLDYKDLDKMRRYITDRGKIVARRNSGACARHQRMVAEAIKRARFVGLVPYCVD